MRWSEESVSIVVPSGDLSKSAISQQVYQVGQETIKACVGTRMQLKDPRPFLCCIYKELRSNSPLSALEITAQVIGV